MMSGWATTDYSMAATPRRERSATPKPFPPRQKNTHTRTRSCVCDCGCATGEERLRDLAVPRTVSESCYTLVFSFIFRTRLRDTVRAGSANREKSTIIYRKEKGRGRMIS